MLFPVEVLAWWAAVAAVVALLMWRYRRARLIWLGLGLMAAGVAYFRTVMAHRPPNYYALLEYLASCLAEAVGLILAVVGGWRLWSARSSRGAAG